MSQIDPTISFLSSPEIHVSGLVYLLLGVLSCSSQETVSISQTALEAPSPPPQAKAAPKKAIDAPPKPNPPTIPSPGHLEVPGFNNAFFIPPEDSLDKPHRVTVVLHGNYDRPEWQCDTWQSVARFYGWVLCPRGVPTPWAEKSADRWMYRGSERTWKEIDAALGALEGRFPGKVNRDEMILAGFSLGAILAPHIVLHHPKQFSYLFLIEGGLDKLDGPMLRGLRRSGIRGIGLAMSSPKYRAAANAILPKIRRMGLGGVYVSMAGAGHDYHPSFAQSRGRAALKQLLSEE